MGASFYIHLFGATLNSGGTGGRRPTGSGGVGGGEVPPMKGSSTNDLYITWNLIAIPHEGARDVECTTSAKNIPAWPQPGGSPDSGKKTKQKHVLFFAPGVSWEPVGCLKILSRGPSAFSIPGATFPRFCFVFLLGFVGQNHNFVNWPVSNWSISPNRFRGIMGLL